MLNDMESERLEVLKGELIRRGTDPAEVAELVASRNQELAQVNKEWKSNTRKRYRESRRHPIKLKENQENGTLFIEESLDPAGAVFSCFETTGFTDQDAANRLINQVVQAQSNALELGNANSALSIMDGLAPETPLEGLLAAQMTTTHNMIMEFSQRAMQPDQYPGAIDWNLSQATKLMRIFTRQAETLQKLRSKGQQNIMVQHVQVNQGGQAVIGDIHQGGGHG